MKRILIVIDGSDNDAESLTSAKSVAVMTAARLTVAHARIPHHSIMGFGDLLYAGDDTENSKQTEARARAAFDDICGDLPDARFLIYEANGETIITALGYSCDLILLERLSSEEGPEAGNLNAALFDTGRPVLLMPPVSTIAEIRQAAISWNETAQSSRAIKSALPLLRSAAEIVLLQGSGAGEVAVDPLLEYLAAHDLSARVQSYDSQRLTARARGRALIAAATQCGADLLVTGAFGEGRPGVLSGLGRATRKVVTAAPMPVLLQS